MIRRAGNLGSILCENGRRADDCAHYGPVGHPCDADRFHTYKRTTLSYSLTAGCGGSGFFPGIIVYLSHWFRYQDRASGGVPMAGILFLNIIGSPLSGG